MPLFDVEGDLFIVLCSPLPSLLWLPLLLEASRLRTSDDEQNRRSGLGKGGNALPSKFTSSTE